MIFKGNEQLQTANGYEGVGRFQFEGAEEHLEKGTVVVVR